MENITLGQIQGIFIFIIALGGSVATLTKSVSVAIKKGLQPINDKIEAVDRNSTMNYLVARIEDIDNGKKLEGVSKKRFVDEYEHYIKDLKGNTYIHDEYERLKKEGKL